MIEHCQTLNYMLKDYNAGRVDRKELEGKIFMYIRTHPRRFFPPQWKDDNCSDFLSWLYPRLSRAIDRYEERGASFDA
jgi:hypothetical protein